MSEALSSTKVSKVTIAPYNKDAPIDAVEAQFNPKELQIDRTVPWNKPTATNKSKNTKDDGSIRLEFGGAEGRSMTIELLFDSYESMVNGATSDKKVETALENLSKMASVKVAGSAKEEEKRPPLLLVVWGSLLNETKKFTGVIENLSIKYQAFAADGTPVRATATVKLKEANVLAIAKPA